MFHYLEICKHNGEDKRLVLNALANIDASIQAFYLLVDNDNGKKMMDVLSDIRNPEKKAKKNEEYKPVNPEDKYADLSKEDRELMEFADSLPEQLDMPDEFKHTGKFILPTRSLKKLKEELGETAYEEVNTADELFGVENSTGPIKDNADKVLEDDVLDEVSYGEFYDDDTDDKG